MANPTDDSASLPHARAAVWAAGSALVVLHLALLALSRRFDYGTALAQSPIRALVALEVVCGLAYLAAVLFARNLRTGKSGLIAALAVGALMRGLIFPSTPILEDDFYRYLWDGGALAHGYNPFEYAPKDLLDGTAGPSALQDLARRSTPVAQRVNHPHLRTIYPMTAQASFALAHAMGPWNLYAWRLVVLVFDLATLMLLALLLRRLGLPSLAALVYWWNPLLVKEAYNSCHMDVVALPFVLGALLLAQRGRYACSAVALALATGAKIWPLALLPVILRPLVSDVRRLTAALLLFGGVSGALFAPVLMSRLDAGSGLAAYGQHWEMNDALFMLVHWCIRVRVKGLGFGPQCAASLARGAVALALLAWVLLVNRRPIHKRDEFVRRALWVVSAMFLLSPTQFPWYSLWFLPFLAVAPRPSLLLLTALLPLYYLRFFYAGQGREDVFDYGVVWLEYAPVLVLLGLERGCAIRNERRARANVSRDEEPPEPDGAIPLSLPQDAHVSVIIPVLNEEASIGRVLSDIPDWVEDVIVVDNGSTDGSAAAARAHGARVVREPRRGYGSACMAGIAALGPTDVVVFLDGDYSDHPDEMGRLVGPILRGEADLVIGSRTLGRREPGALTPQARFGNWLSCRLLRLFWGVRYTDLGPFRAVSLQALDRMSMCDRDYGWTVEMQVKAAILGLAVRETPVSYRRRTGPSKISGTLRGVLGAGTKILYTIFRSAFMSRFGRRRSVVERLVMFTRFPEVGRTKTRMIPLLGPEGAAELQRRMAAHVMTRLVRFRRERRVSVEIRHGGGDACAMRRTFGGAFFYRAQPSGDLGERMSLTFRESFDEGIERVVLIGSDSPAITPSILSQAFDALENHDVVIGPAVDGGYYLLGLRRQLPELFHGMPWSTGDVLARTVDAARRLGASYCLLTILGDIDQPQDLATWERQKPAETGRLSVIIPALDETERLPATIQSVRNAPQTEVIVVDGGSRDATPRLAERCGARVLCCPGGRARQMNLGAEEARGDVLLFLHADTILPFGFEHDVRRTLAAPGVVAGAFELEIADAALSFRLVERLVNYRARRAQYPYGDQAIFLRKSLFERIGGFQDLPIMEDVDLIRRLRRMGRIQIVHRAVRTSARRWRSLGIPLATWTNQAAVVGYLLGVSPDRIGRWYRRH